MANILKTEKKVAVISMLCEGASIRAVERITGVQPEHDYEPWPCALVMPAPKSWMKRCAA